MPRQQKPPAYVENTELVLPPDTNHHGTVFGGRVLQWIDITAAIAAQRFAGFKVVTASIDQMHFILPIELGHIVTLKACINCSHETSMEVGVRVEREDGSTGHIEHAATAYLTFVAMSEKMVPVQVPELIPQNEIERRRMEEAMFRRAHRLEHRTLLLERRKQKK